jgi:hypothetical protein
MTKLSEAELKPDSQVLELEGDGQQGIRET